MRSIWFLCATAVIVMSTMVFAAMAAGATPAPLPRVAGYNLPAELADGHFRMVLSPDAPLISSELAVSLGQEFAGDLARKATGVSVQAVLFTDTVRGAEGKDGSVTLSFVDVPAYIVRFVGVPQPIFGGVGMAQGPAAQELNVVLDSRTGAYVEMFSYK